MGLALPTRVAVLLALFLVLLTITAYTGFFLSNDRAHWSEWTRPSRVLAILVLLVVTPIVLRQALRLWLEGDKSRFPDIDRAWQEGLSLLEQQQLDIRELPLFLLLGGSNDRMCDAVMEAAGYEWLVAGQPQGVWPLRWYANQRAIFVCTPGLGCLSAFSAAAQQATRSQGGTSSITSTLVAGQAAPTIQGTAVASAGSPDSGSIRGTIQPGLQSTLTVDDSPGSAPARGGGTALTRGQIDDQSIQLAYVGELLRQARQPYCACNGLMTLLPLPLIDDLLLAKELPSYLRQDLSTLQRATQLCCPVTVTVVGMEAEPGFAELMRRVGTQRAKEGRFGKGAKVWSYPTPGNLEALTAQACGAFEDWIYALFREDGGLSKPGNGKLFSLLCKMRSRLRNRIRDLLCGGFGCESEEDRQATLLSGCYFAATGNSPDRQGFVRGALDKLLQQEEDLQWTEAALAEDARYRNWAQFCLLLDGCLVIALLSMVVYHFVSR